MFIHKTCSLSQGRQVSLHLCKLLRTYNKKTLQLAKYIQRSHFLEILHQEKFYVGGPATL